MCLCLNSGQPISILSTHLGGRAGQAAAEPVVMLVSSSTDIFETVVFTT